MEIVRHGPLITPESHPAAGTNINGPSLVRMPDWATGRLGRYHLYFADHKGDSIRLAYGDDLTGPYTMYPGGALRLADSRFPTETPQGVVPRGEVQRASVEAEGYDAHYTPHIASPDVIVDEASREFWMAFHGLCEDGAQLTRMARSTDGVHFDAFEPLTAFPYLRIVPEPSGGRRLAMSMPGIVYTTDDLRRWVAGPMLFGNDFRHCALLQRGPTLHVFWTRVGDAPEHILHSTIDIGDDWTTADMTTWTPTEPTSVLWPTEGWEGADLPVEPSARGQVTTRVHQLRDPAVYVEDDRVWLLYAIAGESGIALAEVTGI